MGMSLCSHMKRCQTQWAEWLSAAPPEPPKGGGVKPFPSLAHSCKQLSRTSLYKPISTLEEAENFKARSEQIIRKKIHQ